MRSSFSELAPLLFDLAFDLFPISFNAIPIHACFGLLLVVLKSETTQSSVGDNISPNQGWVGFIVPGDELEVSSED